MIRKAVVVFALLLSAGPSFASPDPALRASVERLFELMNTQQVLEASQAQMKSLMQKQMANVPPEKEAIARRHIARMLVVMQDSLAWDKLRAPMVDAYVKVYTKDEVDALVAFYESPVGRKMTAKMPEMMAVMQAQLQKMMAEMTPRLQQIGQDLDREMRESSKPAPAKKDPAS